jgi:hypothetical protein
MSPKQQKTQCKPFYVLIRIEGSSKLKRKLCSTQAEVRQTLENVKRKYPRGVFTHGRIEDLLRNS